MTAADCASALLRRWISLFGVPSDITTDQGRQFAGSLWSELHKLLGIRSLRTTAYHPQANGMVERFHRVLKERLMARNAGHNWMSHLPMVLLGIRASIREDSLTSPAQLVLGSHLRLPGQLLPAPPPLDVRPTSTFILDLKNSIEMALPMPVIHHGNQRFHLPEALRSARAVYIRVDAVRPPLVRPYDGPFPVISKTDKTFIIRRGNKDITVSVDRLKPAFEFPPATSVPTTLPPSLPDTRDTGGGDSEDGSSNGSSGTGSDPAELAPAGPAGPPDQPHHAIPAVPRSPVRPPDVRTRSGRVSRPPERLNL